MLRRRRRTDPNGGAKQHKIAFDQATTSPDTFRAASPEHPEAAMSPTSILQAMPPSPTTCGGGSTVPFFHGKNHHHHPWEAAAPVGLGLVGSLNKEGSDAKVLTGPKLRIQANEPCSPSTEFGSKNRSGTGAPVYADMVLLSPHRCPSPREMEMSEDYTCVITRGLNPRTTHIFDNCVVESCGFPTYWPGQGKDDFLRYCHGCSKDLGQGKDIFMYRGERAFCSRECRYREMLFDGDVEEC